MYMRIQRLLSIFIVVFTASSVFAKDLKDEISVFTTNYLKTHTLNAIYAVYQDEAPLIEGASGFFYKKLSGDNSKAPEIGLDFKQQMPIASGTKQITAAGILRLKDHGKLEVSDVISKYLPSTSFYWGGKMPAWAEKITIHQLLTHTSGLQEYIPALKIDLSKSHKEINAEIVQFASSVPLLNTPGQKFEYNNTGYVILGLIIEQVSGKELGKFFEDEFFAPLGMKNTHLSDIQEALDYQNGKLSNKYPNRYFIIPGNVPPIFAPVTLDIKLPPFADGGVVSSATDMHIWMNSLYNGKILSSESLALMTKEHVPSLDKMGNKAHYGYGIYVLNVNGKIVYSHGGNAIAIRGEYSYIKDLKASVIILSNTMVHVPEPLEGKIDYSQDHNQVDIMFFNKGLMSILCAE